MKIAIITNGDPYNRKGFFNNVHERIKYLMNNPEVEVDVFLIQHYNNWIVRKLRKQKFQKKEDSIKIDNVTYKYLWLNFSIIDYIKIHKLKNGAYQQEKKLNKFSVIFKDYDLISTHALDGSNLAYNIKLKYNIPFVTTWHGSDIHSSPFVNKYIFNETKKILENADYNFFVSMNLLDVSLKITQKGKRDVLYSGPSNIFFKYDDVERIKMKSKLNCADKIVIAFIGNLIPIKNVRCLPNIFNKINSKISNCVFWIIGDGYLKDDINKAFSRLNLDVKFWGNIDSHKIPMYMNCIELLVLPSLNEGLPRVTLEAYACGTKVIGSNVGGISEAIGIENTCNLDSDFEENMSKLAIQVINSNCQISLDKKFEWDKTVLQELKVYHHLIAHN